MNRHVYLSMQPREKARQIFWSHFADLRTGEETIPARQARGRVSAAPVCARFSSPSFNFAAMDGLAVRAEDTFSARDDMPLTLDLKSGQAVMINTGHPLPENANAVIMIEHVRMSADHAQAVIHAPVYPWQNVRKVGEDIVASELLFPTEHVFQAADIAALITGGCGEVRVRQRPRVAILPTGSELIALDSGLDTLPVGKTLESNSAALAALVEDAGAEALVTPIIQDDYEIIKAQVLDVLAAGADMVLVNAGSSSGTADYTARIIADVGEVFIHGVTMMPGKPVILGAAQGRPIVGVPGYPVSAILAVEEFVMPLLARMQGVRLDTPVVLEAVLAKDIPSRSGMEEFRRMVVGKIGAEYVAVPLKKGAGAITTLTRANAMLRIDAASEGEKQGRTLPVTLLAPQDEIKRTLLCTGSHDPCLELLNDFLCQTTPAYALASTHAGSLGGIFALKSRMCHMAGSHLLEPADGSYNVAALRRYLPDRALRVVTFMHREQGFFVPRGNPRGIHSVHDLVGTGVRFVNRQAGSGTRVLFDYELQRHNLEADDISGYGYDEYTHMAVAVAILSGKADTGLGVRSAANALGLDFVPLAEERYDLLIPEELFDTPMLRTVLDVITSARFRQAVEARGGYSTRETGNLVQG